MSEHIPVDEFTPEDYALLKFIIENANQYGRFEIFLRAKEQVEILSGKTTSWLYKRYHRELYPMIVGEPSKEYVDLHLAKRHPLKSAEQETNKNPVFTEVHEQKRALKK